jgi:hypothetical protein
MNLKYFLAIRRDEEFSRRGPNKKQPLKIKFANSGKGRKIDEPEGKKILEVWYQSTSLMKIFCFQNFLDRSLTMLLRLNTCILRSFQKMAHLTSHQMMKKLTIYPAGRYF